MQSPTNDAALAGETFDTLGFSGPIQTTLDKQGFSTPTTVQQEAIPHALAGRDVLASAQTGSGKTAAFVLPIIQRLVGSHPGRPTRRPTPHHPRALILAPTRELAAQIGDVVKTFSGSTRVSYAVIFGGVNKKPQVTALRRGVDIAVATPGRLLDLMNEGAIALDQVRTIVLDEADRMLDMGFIPDVRRIIAALPEERQSLFFSATLPAEVKRLAGEMLTDPVRVNVERVAADTPKIDQHMLFVTREQKRDALRMLLTERRSYRALVFTRTKFRARDLARHLNKNGITADDLHGNKSQAARQRALSAFHSGKVHVLVATDIASRGIDVDDIDQVINYELPHEAESYVHRIGRTARAGRSGAAFSLCDATELDNLKVIERALEHHIDVVEDHPFHAEEIAAAAIRGRNARPDGKGRGNSRNNNRAGARGNGRGRNNAPRGARSGGQNRSEGSRGNDRRRSGPPRAADTNRSPRRGR